jgi:hypothetical protein
MSQDSTRRLHKADPLRKNSREPLVPAEILELDRALTNVFRMIRETRELNPVANHIKFPSLPAVFSESIVIAAATVLLAQVGSVVTAAMSVTLSLRAPVALRPRGSRLRLRANTHFRN